MAMLQVLRANTAFQNPAVWTPVRRTITMASCAYHILPYGLFDTFIFGEPAHLSVPVYCDSGRLIIEGHSANVTVAAQQSTGCHHHIIRTHTAFNHQCFFSLCKATVAIRTLWRIVMGREAFGPEFLSYRQEEQMCS